MNKTLAFLEVLGRDARLAQSSATELASAARAAGVEPQLAEALGRRDHVAFKHLLSALLLSFGLALPPDGYAAVAAPSETQSTDEDSAPEPEDPPSKEAESPSVTSNERAQADPAPEAAAEGDITEGADDFAPEAEGAAEPETSDAPVDESSESAEPEEDVIQP